MHKVFAQIKAKKGGKRDAVKNDYAIKNKLLLVRIFDQELISIERVKTILNSSSTTIESISKNFSNIMIIKDGNVIVRKGLYLDMPVEYTQASGNNN